jgi:hypothetical protein
MRPVSVLLASLIFGQFVFANDGAFYTKGNHLIPIAESQISITKEILSLKRVNRKHIEVTVYYEFFNPGDDKKLTVGFEAFSPEGDVDGAPIKGLHPNMRDFTVEMNQSILKYNVAYVEDPSYYKNGKVRTLDLNTFKGQIEGNNVEFYYVYHFEAHFKKGINIIKHTYNYDVSGSIDFEYDFEYVLTTAKRWANKQIDDFTLIIDCGPFESFAIAKGFFKNANEWLIHGIGKMHDVKRKPNTVNGSDAVKFHMQKGSIIFHKKDFKIEGDLFLYSENYHNLESFDYIPFSISQARNIGDPKNDFQKKVLRNLPFARRGYVFQNTELSNFFNKMDWYIPNPNYIADVANLTDEEKKWIELWK